MLKSIILHFASRDYSADLQSLRIGEGPCLSAPFCLHYRSIFCSPQDTVQLNVGFARKDAFVDDALSARGGRHAAPSCRPGGEASIDMRRASFSSFFFQTHLFSSSELHRWKWLGLFLGTCYLLSRLGHGGLAGHGSSHCASFLSRSRPLSLPFRASTSRATARASPSCWSRLASCARWARCRDAVPILPGRSKLTARPPIRRRRSIMAMCRRTLPTPTARARFSLAASSASTRACRSPARSPFGPRRLPPS